MVFDPVTAVPHVLKPPVQDRLRKDHGCGRAVSYLVGLHGDLSHYTCAEVLNLVSEEYLFGDGDSVIGDQWHTASHANDNDVPRGTKCTFYKVSSFISALFSAFTASSPNAIRRFVVQYNFAKYTKPDIRRTRLPTHKTNYSTDATFHTGAPGDRQGVGDASPLR